MTEIEAPRLYPALRFRDAGRMIDFLVDAFGFTVHAKHMTDTGKVAHAELAFGSSMLMCGDMKDDAFGAMVGAPEGGGKAIYVAVPDADAAFARAKAAGAEILEGLTERDYGSREFVCRDPEGNVWSFGTYWPKAHQPAA
jgi:uncharacterized glyoxalase superfamily protein PhnB